MSVTPEQILAHRKARKESGMTGCITGQPEPELDFFGYADVQSWRPADPMNPHCFCFDCRDLWDPKALIDTELVNTWHTEASKVYEDLLPKPETKLRPPPLLIPPRTETYLAWPMAPRHRDVMNETKEERIKKDLLDLISSFRGDLIEVMDSRRRTLYYENPQERDEFLKEVSKKEDDLWDKIRAAELLISALDH